jgi:uncharacterized protein (TIRG00374 family)
LETSSISSDNETNNIGIKDRIKAGAKFALVIVVFWLLFRKGVVSASSVNRVLQSQTVLLISILIWVVNTFLGAYRWKVLLAVHGIQMTLKQVFKFHVIGAFFNIALPGAISGDVVKAVWVGKGFPEKRASIAGSVLFDRTLGFCALILVAVISVIYGKIANWGHDLPMGLIYAVVAFGSAVVAFFGYLFISRRHDPLLKLFQWATKKSYRFGSIERTYVGLVHYRNHPAETIKAIMISLVIHSLLISNVFLLAEVLSDVMISFSSLAVVVPIGMLATMIPILPAGVGTGHAAFYALFQMIGSAQGADVFSWLVFFQIALGVLGGVVYLRSK